MSEIPIWNAIAFQIWLSFVLIGIAFSLSSQSFVPATIFPWLGLFIGIATNEILPGFVSEGIKIA